MCLAVPFKIVEVNGDNGVGEYEGVKRNIRLDFIKDPKPGEYVMLHAGFAIERINEKQAQLDLESWKELEDALSE